MSASVTKRCFRKGRLETYNDSHALANGKAQPANCEWCPRQQLQNVANLVIYCTQQHAEAFTARQLHIRSSTMVVRLPKLGRACRAAAIVVLLMLVMPSPARVQALSKANKMSDKDWDRVAEEWDADEEEDPDAPYLRPKGTASYLRSRCTHPCFTNECFLQVQMARRGRLLQTRKYQRLR